MKLFPDEDKHIYLFWSLGLIAFAVALLRLDTNVARAFSVAGGAINLAGACWIAAGVVLRPSDHVRLGTTSLSGGMKYLDRDANKEIIPDMLKVQSRRARFGVLCLLIGTCGQAISAYLA